MTVHRVKKVPALLSGALYGGALHGVALRRGALLLLILGGVGCASPERLVQDGRKYEAAGDCRRAQEAYMDALEKEPTMAAAALGVARCEAAKGYYDNALAWATKAVDQDAPGAQAVRGRIAEAAARRVLESDPEQARAYVERAVADRGATPELLRLRGAVHLLRATRAAERGRSQQALEAVEQALQDDPSNAQGRQLRGHLRLARARVRLHEGKLVEALEWANGALSDNAGQSEAKEVRARVYHALANQHVPSSALGTSVESARQFAQADVERAISLATQSLRDRNDTAVRHYRGRLYLVWARQGTTLDQQLDRAERALRDHPRLEEAAALVSDAALALATEALDRGRSTSALRYLERLKAVNPRYERTHALLARSVPRTATTAAGYDLAHAQLLLDGLRYQEARRLARRSLGHSRYGPEAAFACARAQAARGYLDNAIGFLARFYEEHIEDYAAYRERARQEPEFVALQQDVRYHRWLMGLRRVEVTLAGVSGVPDMDIVGDKSDIFIKVVHDRTLVLTTSVNDPRLKNSHGASLGETYQAVFDYRLAEPIRVEVYDTDAIGPHELIVRGEFYRLGVNRWTLSFGESTSTKVRLDVAIAPSAPQVGTTWTTGHREFLTEPRVLPGGLDPFATPPPPMMAATFDAELLLGLFTCTAQLGISLTMRSFIVRQLLYAILTWMREGAVSMNAQAIEGFTEYMLDRIGSNAARTANNLRVFATCVSNL